jgi:putative flippase GtrA
MRTPDDWLPSVSIGGIGNMLVDFALSPAVTLFGQTAMPAANLISYSCGVATSFVGNGRLTFRGQVSSIDSI